MKKTIEYNNTFHGTAVRVRVADELVGCGDEQEPLQVRLTPDQARRVSRELCGIRECRCGGQSNYWPPLGSDGWAQGGRIV